MQYITTIWSSSLQMFFEIGVLKICNIHRKTPVLESLFSKLASLEACNFIKKRPQHRCFPVNIAKFLRKFYLQNAAFFWTIENDGLTKEAVIKLIAKKNCDKKFIKNWKPVSLPNVDVTFSQRGDQTELKTYCRIRFHLIKMHTL